MPTPDGYQLMASQPAPITTNSVLYKKLNYRSDQIRVRRHHVDHPERAAGEERLSRQDGEGVHRLREGQSRQAELRLAGPRARPRTSPPSCSTSWPAPSWCTCPTRAPRPALNDLVAGHVDFIFMQLESAIKLHEGGKARILAVTTSKRLAELPDIPTMEDGRHQADLRHLERDHGAAEDAGADRRQAQCHAQRILKDAELADSLQGAASAARQLRRGRRPEVHRGRHHALERRDPRREDSADRVIIAPASPLAGRGAISAFMKLARLDGV